MRRLAQVGVVLAMLVAVGLWSALVGSWTDDHGPAMALGFVGGLPIGLVGARAFYEIEDRL